MAARRLLLRVWRRLRRPTFGRLVATSVALHLTVITLAVWLTERHPVPPPAPRAPLVVELPPAAPGRPLVKPEAPLRRPRASPPPAVARPVPAAPAVPPPPSRTPEPSPPPVVARPPEPPPVPSPPVVARPPDEPPASPPPVAARPAEPPPAPSSSSVASVAPAVRPPEPPSRAPSVAAAPPVPAQAPAAPIIPPAPVVPRAPVAEPAPPAPGVPSTPEPKPSLAAKLPEPPEPKESSAPPVRRPEGGTAPAATGPASNPPESPLAGRRFSLLGPRIEVPPELSPPPSGSGGTRPEGSGAGESGRERDGQVVVPLNTPDPKYAEYFLELKKRIEAHWVYPQEAIRRNQSGQGVVEFVLRKDGSVRLVEVVHSSGVAILDRYVENAIKFAAPFPPMPERLATDTLPISLNFTYVLGGLRAFGFR